MSAERRPGELKYEPTQTDENFLEQLVDSVKRIDVGVEATYAAIVMLDERVRANAGSRGGDRMVSAAYVDGFLEAVLQYACDGCWATAIARVEELRHYLQTNGKVQS